MALINCPECGKDVSTEAKVCPNCGKPLAEEQSTSQEQNSGCGKAVLIVFGVIMAFLCDGSEEGIT